MANDQQSKLATHPEQNEPVLLFRVIRIGDQARVLIDKRGFGFLKRHAMLPLIGSILVDVPFEVQSIHRLIITTMYVLASVRTESSRSISGRVNEAIEIWQDGI